MKINRTTIIMDLLGVLCGIVIFLICFLEMKNIILIKNKMLSGVFTRNFEPVINITLGRSKCYEKNEFYPIINYTFSGVDDNCYLQKKGTFKGKSKCTEKEIKEENGINITKIEFKKIQIWRDKNMCSKITKNTTQKVKVNDTNIDKPLFLIIPSEDKCMKYYKKCGYITNKTKQLCMLEGEKNETNECPINYITITNETTTFTNYTKYHILDFIDGYKLIFSNKETNGSIIFDFKISEGEFPCLEIERFANSTKIFPQLKNYYYYGCNSTEIGDTHPNEKYLDGYDDRYIKIDTISKQMLFRDNDLDLNYRELPELYDENKKEIIWKNDIDNANFSLFYRDFYNDKENCENYTIFDENITFLNKYQYLRLVGSLCNILILVILISVLGLMQVVIAVYHTMFFTFKIAFSYGIFLVNFILIEKSRKILPSLTFFINNSKICYDEQSIEIIRRYNIIELSNNLTILFEFEKYFWFAYCLFNFVQTLRLINKIYVRIKNKYRRNIVLEQIGKKNAQKIFDIVRKQKINEGIMEWEYDKRGRIKLKEDNKKENLFNDEI